jgi:hypothetical protein
MICKSSRMHKSNSNPQVCANTPGLSGFGLFLAFWPELFRFSAFAKCSLQSRDWNSRDANYWLGRGMARLFFPQPQGVQPRGLSPEIVRQRPRADSLASFLTWLSWNANQRCRQASFGLHVHILVLRLRFVESARFFYRERKSVPMRTLGGSLGLLEARVIARKTLSQLDKT